VLLMSTIKSFESMLYSQALGSEAEVQRVLETLRILWTVDPQVHLCPRTCFYLGLLWDHTSADPCTLVPHPGWRPAL